MNTRDLAMEPQALPRGEATETNAAIRPEQALEASIRRRIGENRFQMWFAQHTRLMVRETEVQIGVASTHFQEWLQATFGIDVLDAAREIVGSTATVRFVLAPEKFINFDEPKSTQTLFPMPTIKTEKKSAPSNDDAPSMGRSLKPGRRWHTLNDFIVGSCNRVAHASAMSVVEEPGQGANPLVLHGPVGTGKTHLLEGIYTGMRKLWPDAKITFVTAEEFTNRFVQAMRLGKISSFRRQYRESGALLLDNLNFLGSKRATQEEFLHTFDVLAADGRQVVVTCDCHPRLNDDLMPELVDRLIGGAVWGLTPPDRETRLAILRAKSVTGTPGVPENVLKFLADQLRGNVRELEGALHSLRHFSKVTGKPIDLVMAREALGELLRHAIRVLSVADVDAAVCTTLRLPAGSLHAKNRGWAVSHPRMLAIFLARKHTAATYSEISQYFGSKTHSAAVAAEKKVRQWVEKEESLILGEREWRVRELVERIERELQR